MAADVLMGTDENCAAWIRTTRQAGEGGCRRAPTRRAPGEGGGEAAAAAAGARPRLARRVTGAHA